MKTLKPTLFMLALLWPALLHSQQIIWSETFDIPEKGYWGNGTGGIVESMSGITKWTLNVSACTLSDANDYVKTVATSGGRMEAVDIDGEAIWISELINIAGCPNANISVSVSENGTSTNSNKYVKLYYVLDEGPEIPFARNGENIGNFGSVTASQAGLIGNTLRIVIRLNNPNAGDACIFDNVVASFDNVKPFVVSAVAGTENKVWLSFSELVNPADGLNQDNYLLNNTHMPSSVALGNNNASVVLSFSDNFIPETILNLLVSGISDLSGNLMETQSLFFRYSIFSLKRLNVVSSNELNLVFSHPLDGLSAQDINNYYVNKTIGKPLVASLLNDSTVKLLFNGEFLSDSLYLLTVSQLKNSFGVLIAPEEKEFLFHQAAAFDLIINELMVDISPAPNVLPAARYIELHNRCAYPVDITGWQLQIGDNAPLVFPSLTIPEQGFLIVCAPTQLPNLSIYGQTTGILSESQLTISGKLIALYHKDGLLIDYIKYSDKWYNNAAKAAGGWSLERIDPENFCGEASNWQASEDFKGGTPGAKNSVCGNNPDTNKPVLISKQVLSSNRLLLNFSKNLTAATALDHSNYQLDEGTNSLLAINFTDTGRSSLVLQFTEKFTHGQQHRLGFKNLTDYCGNVTIPGETTFTYFLIYPLSAFAESDNLVRLIFSEVPDVLSAQNVLNYSLNNGMGSPLRATRHQTYQNEVFLEFSGEMQQKQNYTLQLQNIMDLDGNSMKPAQLTFTWFSPGSNELIINEILFNPRPGGADFVEIYNKSGFPVDVSKLSLARRNEMQEIELVKNLSAKNMILAPYHFMAITPDTSRIKNDYPAISYDTFLQLPSMPAFNDDKGMVVLLHGEIILDEFSYSEEMHFGLISNPEGVSLERIDPEKPSQTNTNWHSAAASAGWATPANQNSQFRKLSGFGENSVVVEPETISPDNDGYNDVAFIRYQFDEPGYVANVSIYDARGRELKKLAMNQLLAVEGEFAWDGLRQDGRRADIGIYVIYFEVFNLKGVVKKYKKVCVVAEKLN